MRVLELFGGGGGASVGILDVPGVEIVATIDNDPDSLATQDVLGHHAIEMDLSCVKDLLGPVVQGLGHRIDGLHASFPCQCWSLSGKRLGALDPRNGWPWTVAAIDVARPAYFVGENVTGLLSHRGACRKQKIGWKGCPGCYTEDVILPDLRKRFAWVDVWILDAADFGVPQRRKRVFLVAGPGRVEVPVGGFSRAALEEAKAGGLYWRAARGEVPWGEVRGFVGSDGKRPWKTVREALGLVGVMESHGNKETRSDTDRPAHTVGGGGNVMIEGPRVIGGGSNPRGPGRGHERTHRDLTDDVSITITSERIGNYGPWIEGPCVDPEAHRAPYLCEPERLDEPALLHVIRQSGLGQLSPAVLASEHKGARHMTHATAGRSPARASDMLWRATGRRRLTVLECAILQDFDPGHPFQGGKTSQYKQVGNAIPRALARAVWEAVTRAHQECSPVTTRETTPVETRESATTMLDAPEP